MFFRLIKPNWGKPIIKNSPNPEFIKEIMGPDIYEGCFDSEYIKEKNEEGYNIYYFPNHPSSDLYSNSNTRFLNGKNIDVFNFIFCDMDLKDGIYASKDSFLERIKTFKVKPSLVVDSGHGIHVYWAIKDLTRDAYVLSQLALINYFKTDPSVFTVLQLMRYPNTLNTKVHGEFKLVQIIEELSTAKEYNLEDFPEDFFQLEEKTLNKMQTHLDRLDGKIPVTLPSEINSEELPDSFISLIMENIQIYQLFTNPKEFYGDRSAADMKLVNLLYNLDFPKKEAFSVLANTQKALEKGPSRFEYAALTLDKAYVDRTKCEFLTITQRIRKGFNINTDNSVNGPLLFDCLVNRWRKTNVLGLIGGSGVGKTSVALKIFQESVHNNPDNDDIFIFFSLEQPEIEIIDKWIKLVGDKSALSDRLYVVSNEDEEGNPRCIGLQEINEISNKIKKSTGKNIGAIAIDHIHIINKSVDISKTPTFGGEEQQKQFGNKRVLTIETICNQLKPLAKKLDTFLIVLTQTSREKSSGDVAIDKDGAYGTSFYENNMDYIITIWQPLMRVQALTDIYFLAWQYAKVRLKDKNDPIQVYQQKILIYDMDSGDIRTPDYEQFEQFKALLPRAIEARENALKKKVINYGIIDSNLLAKIKNNYSQKS